jgi:glycosyltransferase involved in cell wall biosynthesis
MTFDMGIAGTEQVIRNLVESTNTDEFTPSVLCTDNKIGPLGNKLEEQGYQVISFNRQPGLDFSLIREIHTYINENDIDILHCHQYTPYVYGLLASWGSRAAVVYTEHGRFYPDRYKLKRMLINPILNLSTDAITAISLATKKALIRYEFFPKKSIEVVYNGIMDIRNSTDGSASLDKLREHLGFRDEDCILSTISRLDPIKNQRMMIDAFREIHKNFPNTKLLIVGDGPLREELEGYGKDLINSQHLIFTGFRVDPQKYLQLTDIFLLSSLSEGTSMTLLEAMSFSKPCVVTDAGGNPEIVLNGKTGVVTPNHNTQAFTAGIYSLLEDEVLRTNMGLAGRSRYEEMFTVERMVSTYQEIYRNVCSN